MANAAKNGSKHIKNGASFIKNAPFLGGFVPFFIRDETKPPSDAPKYGGEKTQCKQKLIYKRQ